MLSRLPSTRSFSTSMQFLQTFKHPVNQKLDAHFFISTHRNLSRQTLALRGVWQITSWATSSRTFATQLGALAGRQLVKFKQSQILNRIGWYRSKQIYRPRGSAIQSGRKTHRGFGYSDGSSSFRRKFDQIPGDYIVWGILGLNGIVYLAWNYALMEYRAGNPSPVVKMYNNVLLSWNNIREGRIWTIITSTFSHNDASHIMLNCLSFYFLAPPIVSVLGNASFLALYFLGGITCSALSLLNRSRTDPASASQGASGAIYAVMSFFACYSPKTEFLLFFVLPVPAWLLVTGLFVWDGWSALTKRETRVDGAGHVGGVLAGIAYYLAKRRTLPRIRF